MTAGGTERPLVSIFMFVRNGAGSVRRAMESVRAQTYPDIEFVVQDAVSTDATREILRGYGERLKLVSEPDSGPNEGLWRALNRCSGEFIGSCLADEELLPDAVECAVAALQSHSDVGAVTGDAIITDLAGEQTGFWKSGPFNLVDYLLCDYCPYFVSSFFRRRALLDAGLKSATWGKNCVEFELWCRLAAVSRILYLPQTFAKYASHADQSSNNARDVAVHFTGRLHQIAAMCTKQGPIGDDPLRRTLFVWGHARAFINHALAFGRPETAETLFRITKEFLGGFPSVELAGVRYDENFGRPEPRKRGLTEIFRKPAPAPAIKLPPPLDRPLKTHLYRDLAQRYESQGRLHEALDLWRAIARLNGLTDDQPVGYTAKPA